MTNGRAASAEKIETQIRRWRHNRGLYPGWVVAPFENRNALWARTEQWIQPILAAVLDATPSQRLTWLRELTWRYETCLMPLFGDFAEAIRQALAEACPFPELPAFEGATFRPTLDNSTEVDWRDLSEAWVALASSLARYYRETRELDRFEELANAMQPLVAVFPETTSFLAYQRCLLALEGLDHAEARRIISGWDSAALPDPFWAVRRAAVRAEIGDADAAETEADAALRAIREMAARSTISEITGAEDIDAFSREGWAMMVVGGVKVGRRLLSREVAPDYRGRWAELDTFRCNPWADIEWLQAALDAPPPPPGTTEAPRGRVRLTFRGEGVFQRLRPALQAVRLLEEAGYPVRALGVKLGAALLEPAIKWFSSELPDRALSLLMRLREREPLDAFLSDHRVAILTSTETERARVVALSALSQGTRILTSGGGRNADPGSWDAAHQSVETALRVLKGLVARLPADQLRDTLTRALELRRQPMLASDYQISELIDAIVSRILARMPPPEIAQYVLQIVSQPLLGVDYRTITDDWADDLAQHLLRTMLPPPNRDAAPTQWREVVIRLLHSVASGPYVTRAQAALRCAILHRVGALRQEEVEALLNATWGADSSIWPDLPLLPPWIVLMLPEPRPGAAEIAFKARVLEGPLSTFGSSFKTLEGTVRQGWTMGGTAPSDKLVNVLQATAPPWDPWSSQRVVPAVHWAPEDVQRLVTQINDWWNNEGNELAAQSSSLGPFAVSLPPRFDHILGVLASVVLPALPPGHSTFATAAALLNHMKDAGIAIDAALPIALAADPNAYEETATSLRLSLVSTQLKRITAALGALYTWLGAAEERLLPQPPSDLIQEVGAMIKARRGPALAEAMSYASIIILQSPIGAAELIMDAVRVGLQYLAAETRYRRVPDPSATIRFEDTPRIRVLAAGLAGALAQKIGGDDPTVRIWAQEMSEEPLSEVRLAMTEAERRPLPR